jgi:predicted nucleic acid-binding protein
MTFADIPSGVTVFLDANVLIYHFTNDATYGTACTALLRRIDRREIHGAISAHVLADSAHRLMTIEARIRLGWPVAGLAARLRSHHAHIATLTVYRQAISALRASPIQVLAVSHSAVELATQLTRQYELLMGDALVAAIMQTHGLTHLASRDTDFDRAACIIRYSPT